MRQLQVDVNDEEEAELRRLEGGSQVPPHPVSVHRDVGVASQSVAEASRSVAEMSWRRRGLSRTKCRSVAMGAMLAHTPWFDALVCEQR